MTVVFSDHLGGKVVDERAMQGTLLQGDELGQENFSRHVSNRIPQPPVIRHSHSSPPEGCGWDFGGNRGISLLDGQESGRWEL